MPNRAAFTRVLRAALRTNELVAMGSGDIDLLREEVIVSRAMTQASKGQAEATKSFRILERLRAGLATDRSGRRCGYQL
jgi:hypothetical protein